MQTLKSLFRQALPPFLFCLVVFAGAEIFFRLYPPPQATDPYHTTFTTHDGRVISTSDGPLKLAFAPYTLYKNLPNQATSHFTINSTGQRGGEIPPKSERTRILLIGASTAFGMGARNDADTFAQRFAALDDNREVINGAVIGFVSGQELTYLLTELLDFEPDIVLGLDAYADIFDAWYLWHAKGQRKAPEHLNYNLMVMPQIERNLVENYHTETRVLTAGARFLRTMMGQSVLLNYLGKKIDELRERVRRTWRANQTLPPEMPEDYYQAVLQTYLDNLKQIQRLCDRHGIAYIAMLQPDLGLKINRTPQEDAIMGQMNQLVPNYTERYVPVFERFVSDAHAHLREAGIETLVTHRHPRLRFSERTLYEDSAHFNSAGQAAFAALLDEYFDNRARLAAGQPVNLPTLALDRNWQASPGATFELDATGALPVSVPAAATAAVHSASPIQCGTAPVLLMAQLSSEDIGQATAVLRLSSAKRPGHAVTLSFPLKSTLDGMRIGGVLQPMDGLLDYSLVIEREGGEGPAAVSLQALSLFPLPVSNAGWQTLPAENPRYNAGNAGGAIEAGPEGFRLRLSPQGPRANLALPLSLSQVESSREVLLLRVQGQNPDRAEGAARLRLDLPGGGCALMRKPLVAGQAEWRLLTGVALWHEAPGSSGTMGIEVESRTAPASEWRIDDMQTVRQPNPVFDFYASLLQEGKETP